MIGRTQAQRSSAVRTLKRIGLVLAAAYGTAALVFGGLAFVRNRDAALSEAEAAASRQRARAIQEALVASQSSQGLKTTDTLKAVGIIQKLFESEAKKSNCTVVEYRAASEVLPYLTRYAKKTTVSGWSQVETQVTLSGKPKDVARTFSSVASMSIPFELDSLEVSREKTNATGEATVIAHATLRVLIRKAAA